MGLILYEFSLPFSIKTFNFLRIFGTQMAEQRVGILDTYQNTPSFVRFQSLDATAPAPLASGF